MRLLSLSLFFILTVILSFTGYAVGFAYTTDLGWRINEAEFDKLDKKARETLEKAEHLFQKKEYVKAQHAYAQIMRRWKNTEIAPQAKLRLGDCLVMREMDYKAYKEYSEFIEKYPRSNLFDLAIRREKKIADIFLHGKKASLLKMPLFKGYDNAIEIYKHILEHALFHPLADEIRFNIGQVYEQKQEWEEAIYSYQELADNHPASKYYPNAIFKIGYCYYKQSLPADYDPTAGKQARLYLQDFIYEFPNSSLVPEAKNLISLLREEEARGLMKVVHYYNRQQNPEAARIYLRHVINKFPDTKYAEEASNLLAKYSPNNSE